MGKYLSIILALTLFACHKPSNEKGKAMEDTHTETFQKSIVDQEITTASGLKYIDEMIKVFIYITISQTELHLLMEVLSQNHLSAFLFVTHPLVDVMQSDLMLRLL